MRPGKLKELIEIRKKLGMPDHRLDELKECELCDFSDVTIQTEPPPCSCTLENTSGHSDESKAEVDEALVQRITDQIMEQLNA